MVEEKLQRYKNLTAMKFRSMHQAASHLPLTILPKNLI